jgi:hypothetical protein
VAFLQRGGDAVLVLDGGLQTGGLREIISLAAVGDQNVHPILLSHTVDMIQTLPRAVKPAGTTRA